MLSRSKRCIDSCCKCRSRPPFLPSVSESLFLSVNSAEKIIIIINTIYYYKKQHENTIKKWDYSPAASGEESTAPAAATSAVIADRVGLDGGNRVASSVGGSAKSSKSRRWRSRTARLSVIQLSRARPMCASRYREASRRSSRIRPAEWSYG